MPTFYVDASVRDDILYPGAQGCPVTTPNVPDAVWLNIAGAQDWVVVMKDKRVRTRRWEREALASAGVGAFCMTAAGNYTKWQTLQLLARRWDGIEETATTLTGPYMYSVTNAGVRSLTK